MPILTGAIDFEGALVDVQFAWSDAGIRRLRASLRPIPQPVAMRALIDTGSEVTCVDPIQIHSLGLPVRGSTSLNVPATGGLSFSWQRDASLTILHPSGNAADHLVIGDLAVVEVPLGNLGYQALVGRDVLARCCFLFDGPNDGFELNY